MCTIRYHTAFQVGMKNYMWQWYHKIITPNDIVPILILVSVHSTILIQEWNSTMRHSTENMAVTTVYNMRQCEFQYANLISRQN